MSRAIQEQSLDGATATGAGSQLETGGRITHSLFVVADTEPTNLAVEVEASMDGQNFAPIRDAAGNKVLAVSHSDNAFTDTDGDGDYAAFVSAHGIAARHLRARITDYGSAGNVDVWVASTSNSERAYDYREYPGT